MNAYSVKAIRLGTSVLDKKRGFSKHQRFGGATRQIPRQGHFRDSKRREGYRLRCHAVESGKTSELLDEALDCARRREYEEAQFLFEELLSRHPQVCRAWVSYAQMMKRWCREDMIEAYDSARRILQRGLQINPTSACLAQAWGLQELKRGNNLGAVKLLERSVTLDPSCSPVLNWKPVLKAKNSIQHSKHATRKRV